MYAKAHIFPKRTRGSARSDRSAHHVEAVFRRLIALKPYDQICAADVASMAGLARSTIYRKWAGLDDLFWSVVRPQWEAIAKAVIAGNLRDAGAALLALWSIPGHKGAMRCDRLAVEVGSRVATLFASEMERVGHRRHADAFGLLASSTMMAFISTQLTDDELEQPALDRLFTLLHAAASATPGRGLNDSVERQAASSLGRFPAAVSLRESLANDDYIVSMIDGRPYRALKRHLVRFGMTPEAYRRCFGLPPDYPMVAKSYSERRKRLAREAFAGRSRARPLPGPTELACG